MTPQEAQEYGVIPLIVILTLFAIACVLIWRHDSRRQAKACADWMEQQRALAVLRGTTPAVQVAVVPVGTDFEGSGFAQRGAMQFADDASDPMRMDHPQWIEPPAWTSMHECAVGGPGPGNNFGHSAGLANDGFHDH